MHPRHFKKSKCMTIYVVVFCLWEGVGYTSSYFLSASSAKNLASFSWFSKASIRSSSDKLRFSKTLRILQPKNMPNGGITTDYSAPRGPYNSPNNNEVIQMWVIIPSQSWPILISPKAWMTPNKREHKTWVHFLAKSFILFLKVWFILLGLLASATNTTTKYLWLAFIGLSSAVWNF